MNFDQQAVNWRLIALFCRMSYVCFLGKMSPDIWHLTKPVHGGNAVPYGIHALLCIRSLTSTIHTFVRYPEGHLNHCNLLFPALFYSIFFFPLFIPVSAWILAGDLLVQLYFKYLYVTGPLHKTSRSTCCIMMILISHVSSNA